MHSARATSGVAGNFDHGPQDKSCNNNSHGRVPHTFAFLANVWVRAAHANGPPSTILLPFHVLKL
jgi:hypothetical protein